MAVHCVLSIEAEYTMCGLTGIIELMEGLIQHATG